MFTLIQQSASGNARGVEVLLSNLLLHLKNECEGILRKSLLRLVLRAPSRNALFCGGKFNARIHGLVDVSLSL
jgi:hypothetical protein